MNYAYEVVIGTEHPDKKIDWQSESLKRIPVVSYEDAVRDCDLVVLSVKGTVAESVAARIAPFTRGKTVIDTTNPITETPPENGVLHFFTNLDRSLMERLQSSAPDSNFVKAWNSIGSALQVNPDFGDDTPTMFICGNDEAAKKEVADIVRMFGFDVEDMGSVVSARAIEPLCMLWCIPGFEKGEWLHAFKLLKK